jgi:selenocysteine-specific elongation factor
LESRAADHESAEALILSLVTRDNAALRSGLLVKSRFSQAEVAAAADSLIRKKQVVADGNWLIDGRWWQKRLDDAGSVIKAFHRASPQLQGMDLTEFANQTAGALPDKKLLDLMVASLCSAGYVRTGKVIRWGAHRPSLPAQLQQAGAKIRAALAKNLLEPPNAGELAPSPVDKQALKFLLDTGEAVQLDEKAVLSIEGFEKLKGAIVDHLQKSGKATASDLRQVTGTTRRILIPFLERMDRDGVTRRNGDFRTLKA